MPVPVLVLGGVVARHVASHAETPQASKPRSVFCVKLNTSVLGDALVHRYVTTLVVPALGLHGGVRNRRRIGGHA